MSYELFIARRIIFGSSGHARISRPVIRLAILSVALGLAVMIVAVTVVTGFRNEIEKKVTGFNAHLRINNFDNNNSYEETPFEKDQPFYNVIKKNQDVKHIQAYATKAGIIKTRTEIEGILLKGAGPDFDWSFFNDKIIEGKPFMPDGKTAGKDVLISKNTATLLQLKNGDPVLVYFIQQPPRVRKFNISGIYQTGLEEFDNLYMICDIAQVQQLNDWTPGQVAGFEVTLHDFEKLDEVAPLIYNQVGFRFNTRTIKELYPQIFNWLELQNINVYIIISLMILVAGINMISTLLIIILENVSMIGILKSLGAKDISIRKVFLYMASFLVGSGMLAGNIIALTLCGLQYYFGIIKLPQESYYVSVVPVNFSIGYIALINAGTLLACMAMLIIPSMVVSRISPVKAIRFD